MKITAIIPARGGSKRLKDKNIFPVWGRPMLYWAVEACRDSRYKIDVWVSTDSEDIAQVAKECGANVVMRDETTSNDKAFKQEAIRDAARKIDEIKGPSDVYISLQANSPEVRSWDIDNGINMLLSKKKDEIISANPDHTQNGAFRIFRGEYVYQRDLSTNCGFFVTGELRDVHTREDVIWIETRKKEECEDEEDQIR